MMIMTSTLLVRHLPAELSDEEKEDLLKHFGACEVRCIGPKSKLNNTKTSVAFAKFQSTAAAQIALSRLHQLEVLDHVLCVEYARGESAGIKPGKGQNVTEDEDDKFQKNYETFLRKLNAWNYNLNFNQPPPPHLKYQYPPPTQRVLLNVVQVMAGVPKFYTQVLHLMNKMNLPCPFDASLLGSELLFEGKNEPKDRPQCEDKCVQAFIAQPKEDKSVGRSSEDDEESEMESEEDSGLNIQEVIPAKRPLPQKKVVKRPKFVKPMASTPTKAAQKQTPEEVFEKVVREPQKKIELKLSVPEEKADENVEAQSAAVTTENSSGGFGLIFPSNKPQDGENQEEAESKDDGDAGCISIEELNENRIPEKDRKILPAFRNYQPGEPSCRLYLKNLSKQVTQRDLCYVFNRYLDRHDEEQMKMFDVRLMKEGRMKDQAFVTLPSIKRAQSAMRETNGFILKGKPVVVQFARSAKPKAT